MLKLIVSNTEPSSETFCQSKPPPNNGAPFASEVWLKGPYLYLMVTQDPSHYLGCELVLEVEESHEKYGEGTVICHFPKIAVEQFRSYIDEDDTLYGIIMIQFQMKILEQLFLFCATHYASKLIIYTDDTQADELEIYQNFLTYESQTLTQNGEQTEMIIPADPQTFKDWIDFMDRVTLKLRQTLWQDQRTNFAIRQYLKTHPL